MSARAAEGNIRRDTVFLNPSKCSYRQISVFRGNGNQGNGISRFGGRRGYSEQRPCTQPILLD